MTTDLLVKISSNGYYDVSLDADGDFSSGDFFDSSILYSIYGEARASESEVSLSQNRRGWIGNEGQAREDGSKIWLYFQARLTRDTFNGIQSAAAAALQWLVDDGYLKDIEVTANLQNGFVNLSIVLYRFNAQVERRYYNLWENTGVSSAA